VFLNCENLFLLCFHGRIIPIFTIFRDQYNTICSGDFTLFHFAAEKREHEKRGKLRNNLLSMLEQVPDNPA
jgi:hypothetical protein